MHSAHTTFVGTPLPQHSLLSGQTWWGPHTWRDHSGNTVNDIHDPPHAQQSEVKVDVSRIFAQHFPKLGPHLTTNLHVFFRPWIGSMNLIKIKKRPRKCAPPFDTPPLVRLAEEARRNLTKFLSLSIKVVPRQSEAVLVCFWTDEKPYKCIGSKWRLQASMGLKGLKVVDNKILIPHPCRKACKSDAICT